ncbi:MAG: YggS family pyridoxal phosphate-dependent enzyme [Candidatus Omnitrophica bacterium]|nr:YggS family pyridoxal phosphate-dependent enzyme [Candidatus Omnitrophota bacterium]MDD5671838.1 YggS family pyridoxal phosphate-dependent enzyme [Candidatus Omnitrophota bacterium]
MTTAVSDKLEVLRASIARAAQKAGRAPEEVRFVLVTKTVPVERVREAYEAGVRDFGENRMQEFLAKENELPADVCWHFVGHLQTNKVKDLLKHSAGAGGKIGLLHSMDRPELAAEIERQALLKGIREVPCLLQVNYSAEASKGGFAPGDVAGFVAKLGNDSPLSIRGLMTIGPLTEDESRVRASFRGMRELREELRSKFPLRRWDILSMGMSADYEIAVEEGANLLRIGSAVFGAREAT